MSSIRRTPRQLGTACWQLAVAVAAVVAAAEAAVVVAAEVAVVGAVAVAAAALAAACRGELAVSANPERSTIALTNADHNMAGLDTFDPANPFRATLAAYRRKQAPA